VVGRPGVDRRLAEQSRIEAAVAGAGEAGGEEDDGEREAERAGLHCLSVAR
jgi:hypothetical protein